MFELCKQFRFEAAHTLRRAVSAEPSRRIHGHSYRAEVIVRGEADPATGMVLDLGLFETVLGAIQHELDHRFLDEIRDLGPATLENLSRWIWKRGEGSLPHLFKVVVHRDSTGDSCSYFGPAPLDRPVKTQSA